MDNRREKSLTAVVFSSASGIALTRNLDRPANVADLKSVLLERAA